MLWSGEHICASSIIRPGQVIEDRVSEIDYAGGRRRTISSERYSWRRSGRRSRREASPSLHLERTEQTKRASQRSCSSQRKGWGHTKFVIFPQSFLKILTGVWCEQFRCQAPRGHGADNDGSREGYYSAVRVLPFLQRLQVSPHNAFMMDIQPKLTTCFTHTEY